MRHMPCFDGAPHTYNWKATCNNVCFVFKYFSFNRDSSETFVYVMRTSGLVGSHCMQTNVGQCIEIIVVFSNVYSVLALNYLHDHVWS